MTADRLAARAPKQARSAETSRRLLEAAEELLQEQSFDQTSVADISARAGVTIGAFYARFGDKDTLLATLESRMMEAFSSLADRQSEPARFDDSDIEQVLRDQHTKLVNIYRTHRGVARALVLRSHSDPAMRRRLERLNRRNLVMVAKAIAKQSGISNPAAERMVLFALLTVRSVCREVILFNQGWPGGKHISDAALITELTRMVVAYIGISSH